MAKNIEINIKGSDGNYEVLYPSVNPNILKLDSGNINIDDNVNEKLGLADGSTVSDVLNKLSTGVFYGETEVEVNLNWRLKNVVDANYLNGVYVFKGNFDIESSSYRLYYSTNLKENLNECIFIKDSTVISQTSIYLSHIVVSQNAFWILKSDSLSSGSNKYVELFKSEDGITFKFIVRIGYAYANYSRLNLKLLDDNSLFTMLQDVDNDDDYYTYYFYKSSISDYSSWTQISTYIGNGANYSAAMLYSTDKNIVMFERTTENSFNSLLCTKDLINWKVINYSLSSASTYLHNITYKATPNGFYGFGTYHSNSLSGKKYNVNYDAGTVTYSSFNWPTVSTSSVYFSPAYANGMWLGYIEYSYSILRRRDSDSSFSIVATVNNGGLTQETGTNYVYYLNNEFLIFPISGNKLIRTKNGEDYSITWPEKQNRIKNALESVIGIDTIQIVNKYEVITYTGDGTNSISILFQRPPHLVLVQSTNAGSNSSLGMIFKDVPYITTWWIGSEYFIDGEEKVRFSTDGTQITIYRDSGSGNYEQVLNASGITYYVIGLY